MQAAAAQDYKEVETQAQGAAAQEYREVQPQYNTETAYQPQYNTETAYQPQNNTGTGFQPQYNTETAYQPQPYDSSLDDYYEDRNQTAKNLGAAALGLSIGGFITGWFGLGLLLDLVAIVLGAISVNMNRFKKGLGIAAISVASVGFLLTMLVYGFAFSEWRESGESSSWFDDEPAAITQDYDYDYDQDDLVVPETQSQTGTDTAKSKEKLHYSVGDTVTVQTENGEYAFRINGISETAERNQYAGSNPDRVVLIDYEYENISYAVEYDNYYNDKLYMGSYNFEFYDADGHSMNEYPISYEYPHSITPGHKTSGQMALGLNNDTNYIEMELDDYDYKGPGIVIDLDW